MSRYLSRLVERFPAYVPGEQPRGRTYIKLNTNENPYGPSPRVVEAIRAAAGGRLNLYPDPLCLDLRRAIAARYGLSEEQIFVGNGADEVLRLAMTAFAGPGTPVVFPAASYPLYRTLAVLAGCLPEEVPVDRHFFPSQEFFSSYRDCFTILCNPNSPTGTWLPSSAVENLVRSRRRVVLVDEAYADFAEETCLPLVGRYDNLVVCRTFSKAFGLAGIRVGWCAGSRRLIAALFAIKDSYNVDILAQAAALAAVRDIRHMERARKKILATRGRLERALVRLGFSVVPSQANFLFAKPPGISAQEYYRNLKERGILVRWFDAPRLRQHVRITIGTDREVDVLLSKTTSLVG